MPENKEFFVHVDGQLVLVTEEIYLAYYRSKRRDRYYERDIKTESAVRDSDGNIVGYRPAKEDSLERLMESGEDYEDDGAGVEDAALLTVMGGNLRDVLCLLKEDERALIDALFFSNGGMTERDCAALLGISKTALHARKIKVFTKLRGLLENNFQKS